MGSSLRSLFVPRTGSELRPVLAALAHGGFEPWWDYDRAETERDLHAALELGTYDVLIYEHGAAIPMDRVRAALAAHAPTLPLVVRGSLATLAADVRQALGG